jgi:acyl carrier protein
MSNVDTAALLDQVREVMAATFALDESDLPNDVSQQTCRRWTSLQHMTLMVALEEQFGVRLSMADMAAMKSLPQIVTTLKTYTESAAA